MEYENQQLRREIASLKAEVRQAEDRLVQEESANGDLSARLGNAMALLKRPGVGEGELADTGGRNARRRRSPPAVRTGNPASPRSPRSPAGSTPCPPTPEATSVRRLGDVRARPIPARRAGSKTRPSGSPWPAASRRPPTPAAVDGRLCGSRSSVTARSRPIFSGRVQ